MTHKRGKAYWDSNSYAVPMGNKSLKRHQILDGKDTYTSSGFAKGLASELIYSANGQ